MNKSYYTLKGYDLLECKKITYAMEDYLEMICRVCNEKGFIRVSELSKRLNVKPSSVTKMVNNLKGISLVASEKYGDIRMTEIGEEIGCYLIYRHNVLHKFLCFLNNSKDELEQVEKIEHYLNKNTIKNIEGLLQKLD